MAGASRPRPIGLILDAPVTGLLARIAMASPFAISGIGKLIDWHGAVGEAAGLIPAAAVPTAAATILTQLIGSVLLLTRRLCWLGAGMLGVFTAIATLIAHAFWQSQGAERVHQMATFFEHVAIIGGFAAIAMLVNGSRSTP